MKRAIVLATFMALAPATASIAYFPPGATVVSASVQSGELADDASVTTDVSGDGHTAVFQTRATNFFSDDDPIGTDRLGGVFAKNLDTGVLSLVASGDEVDEQTGDLRRTGARNPSVSGDGRYVAFSTAYPLVPQDGNGAIDVYVRDMGKAPSDPDAYALVSATNGTDDPPTYTYPPDAVAGSRPGADIWPLTSISADGTKVVFRTTAPSDLAPNAGTGQVFVRDLKTKATQLVTAASADNSPAGGAAGPTAISADGTTVVWAGANAAKQTTFLTGEPYSVVDNYYLWRRIAAGRDAVTKRITGLVDLDDPGCSSSSSINNDPSALGPCYGPLTTTDQGGASISGRQLGLSGDGYRIWFLTPGFPRPTPLFSGTLDVFTTDMHSGLTRKASTVELSREGSPDDPAANGGIDGLAVTPDGHWLALTTTRTSFGTGKLALTGSPRAVPDTREIYEADLTTNSLERVLTGFGGGDAVGGEAGAAVSISDDGTRIGLVSGASNLFFGDANNRTDAFVATRGAPPSTDAPPPEATPTNVPIDTTPPPDPPQLKVKVTASDRDTVTLSVKVPSAGKLAVDVRGRVPAAGGAERPVKRFATATAKAAKPRTVTVTVTLAKRFHRPLNRLGRLNASARVTFRPAITGQPLVAAAPVRFKARG